MSDARHSLFRYSGLLVVVIITAALLAWWWLASSTQKANVPVAVPVVAGTVGQRDVPLWLTGVGTVQSQHNVTLRSQVDGILTEVLFREGQTVKKGQLLARIDDRAIAASLDQARAEKARNEAQLKVAELDLVRYRNLLKDEAVPRQTLEQQQALVSQTKAALAASVASIAASEVQLSHTRIVSPVSGRVGLRRIDAGNVVRESDAEGLVTVTQIDPIALIFSLPQQNLLQVQQLLSRKGRDVPVIAFDRDQQVPLARGHLSTIDNAIDAATGTIRLKAEFGNKGGTLWPGQFVSVKTLIDTRSNALVVDTRAVRQGLEGDYVFRIRDSKAEVVKVKKIYEDDRIAIVTDNLVAGDHIVVDGYSRITAGTHIHITETQAAPADDTQQSETKAGATKQTADASAAKRKGG